MTVIVQELYQALVKAGVEEPLALAAAKSVIAAEDKATLATKADLIELRLTMKAEIAEAKSAIIVWVVGTMSLLTALTYAIARYSKG